MTLNYLVFIHILTDLAKIDYKFTNKPKPRSDSVCSKLID